MTAAKIACGFCGKLNKVDVSRQADRPKCADCGRPFLLDRPLKVLGEHFDATVLEAGVPVLVDFYADWCGPCVAMSPLLDDVAGEVAGRALVVKVDTDRSPELGQRYGVRSIPFFARFEQGELVQSAVGTQSRDQLLALASPTVTPQA